MMAAAAGLLTLAVGAPWEPQGPAGIRGGQVENIENLPVAGAVNALAPHPDNPDVLYVGSVNGGVWKTTTATAMVPQWEAQTDTQLSPSIGAITFDPSDETHQTLVAGIARSSAFNTQGGSRSGLLRTTDGGQSWAALTALAGRNVVGVEASGNRIVAASNGGDTGTCEDLGLFVSEDAGQSFDPVNRGIPIGVVDALARDPGNPDIVFAAVFLASLCTPSGQNGIYRSADFGDTWAKISPSGDTLALDALLQDLPGTHVEMAVGPEGGLFVAVVPGNSLQLEGVFFTEDSGNSWIGMDLPGSLEPLFQGIHPSRQGFVHLSLAADPVNPSRVYIGGDRQPQSDDGSFPNAIGAEDFSGRLFRGDLSRSPGFQWTPITHGGTFAGSAPHADSRELTFDSAGELLDANDGGVYRHSGADGFFGDWFSVNGNLQITETHDGRLDPVSGVILGGNQDTGSTQQSVPGALLWESVNTGDGGDVAVANFGTQSVRYHSFSFFGAPTRSVYSASNQLMSITALGLSLLNMSPELEPQFKTPLEVNKVEPMALLIGAGNGLYESVDQGDTVRQVLADVAVDGFLGTSLVYGHRDNPGLVYAAACSPSCRSQTPSQIWLRRQANADFDVIFTATGTDRITAIAAGLEAGSLFLLADGKVQQLRDFGRQVSDLTGNLMDLNPGRLRSLLWVSLSADGALLAGTDRGVFVAFESGGYQVWRRLDMGLPNAPVFDLDYADTRDWLLASTLGRGSFLLRGLNSLLPGIFRDGFE
ncbi:MAG: WD40/YVTN/BNR-like repeat-containing protein [Lysobacterales bacterium]